MLPQNHPQAFDAKDLVTLECAFNATLTTLKTNDPFRDWDRDGELRTKLAAKLSALAATGITSPDELGRRALEDMELVQSSTLSARAVGF